jgi:hypothetical protein
MEILSNNGASIFTNPNSDQLQSSYTLLYEFKEKVHQIYTKSLTKNQITLKRYTESLDFYVKWLISMKDQAISHIQTAIKENFLHKSIIIKEIDKIIDNISAIQHQTHNNDYEIDIETEIKENVLAIENNSKFFTYSFIENGSWMNQLCPLAKIESKFISLGYADNKHRNFRWVSIDNSTKQEKVFNKIIENQLERGYKLNSSQYYIHYQNHGPVFAVANFLTMKLTYTDTNRSFTLMRKTSNI